MYCKIFISLQPNINKTTNRELLEQIYRLLLEISEKVKEIDNDNEILYI